MLVRFVGRNLSFSTKSFSFFSKSKFSSSPTSKTTQSTQSLKETSPYFQIDAKISDKPEFRDTANNSPFPVYRCINESGKVLRSDWTMPVDSNTAIKMYKTMVLESVFDDIFYKLCRVGQTTFYMQNTGEEACQIGSAAAWTLDDVIFFQYRELGTFLYRGYDIQEAAHTNFNNDSGNGRGKQMPVHYGNKSLNCVTISSPLSTQMPQASGAAYAIKRNKTNDRCVICYFGDGAASEGDCHVAFNMSATMECPIIWFCRNNGYAISTPTQDQYRGDGIACRAYGYGMIGSRVDGNDIFAVYEVSKKARELCINNSRPVLIEAMTYRGSHHSTSDDASTYRESSEQDWWRDIGNPIRRMKLFLLNENLWNEKEEKEYYNYCQTEVNNAYKNAQNEKMSNWKELFLDVYDKITPRLKKQMEQLEIHLNKYGNEKYYNLNSYKSQLTRDIN